MPNQPKTPVVTFRIGDELMELARAKAASEGVTVSDVVRAALEEYLKVVDKV